MATEESSLIERDGVAASTWIAGRLIMVNQYHQIRLDGFPFIHVFQLLSTISVHK